MTKKTTDLNPARNEKHQQWDKLRYIPKFIFISMGCVFVAFVASILSVLGLFSSTAANAKVDYELPKMQAEIDQSVNRTELYIVYIQDLQAELKIHGFEVPPLPEE